MAHTFTFTVKAEDPRRADRIVFGRFTNVVVAVHNEGGSDVELLLTSYNGASPDTASGLLLKKGETNLFIGSIVEAYISGPRGEATLTISHLGTS